MSKCLIYPDKFQMIKEFLERDGSVLTKDQEIEVLKICVTDDVAETLEKVNKNLEKITVELNHIN